VLRNIKVLPRTTAAAALDVWAWGRHTMGRGLDDGGHFATREVFLGLGDLYVDQFAWKRAGHKHHTAIGQVPKCVSASNQPLETHLLVIHCISLYEPNVGQLG
jgi:hypothetical protein